MLKLKICIWCWFRFLDILFFCWNIFFCFILYILWLKYCKNYIDFFLFKLVLMEIFIWELWMEWNIILMGLGSFFLLYFIMCFFRVRLGLNRLRIVKVWIIFIFEVFWWYLLYMYMNVIIKYCKYILIWLLNMYYNRYMNIKNDILF